jgi:hypothetical protein
MVCSKELASVGSREAIKVVGSGSEEIASPPGKNE